MDWLLIALAALFGLVIGSFLNVVIARVPEGASLWPRSACPICHGAIAARDNIPLVSWLLLRGRCRTCRTPIAWRYPAVEAATAIAFAAVTAWQGLSPALPAYLYLAALAIALTVIDWRVRRLPNAIVLPSYPVVLALLAVASGFTGNWGAFGRALVAGAGMAAFYWVVCLIVPKGMGVGDAKLSGILGLALGWIGWGAVAVGFLAPFALGAVFGIVTMIITRTGRGTTIPFGPWMCAGTALGCGAGLPIWSAYLGVIGL
jgi:leader peptidase (prepilin peptidase)/N-methyltransferase